MPSAWQLSTITNSRRAGTVCRAAAKSLAGRVEPARSNGSTSWGIR
ncbi:MAG: hypothetical protein HZY76_16535 [Anaerolineae bacterium]|nr:MAG: hypothetical protein HZY76_16535 [Anaerolineae bacterium]